MTLRFIPVVAAVIVDGGRLLLCQRRDGSHLPLLWEFPGGKVHAGESPRQALVRELREELGVGASVGPLFEEVRHSYPEKNVWIRFYGTRIDADPRPRVHRRLRWVPLSRLHRYRVPPANEPVIERLLDEGAIAVETDAPVDPGPPSRRRR